MKFFLSKMQRENLNRFRALMANKLLTRETVLALTPEQVDNFNYIANMSHNAVIYKAKTNPMVQGTISGGHLYFYSSRANLDAISSFISKNRLTLNDILTFKIPAGNFEVDARICSLFVNGKLSWNNMLELTPSQEKNLYYDEIHDLMMDDCLTLDQVNTLTPMQCGQLDIPDVRKCVKNGTMLLQNIPNPPEPVRTYPEDGTIKDILLWSASQPQNIQDIISGLSNPKTVFLNTEYVNTRQLLALLWTAAHHEKIEKEMNGDTLFVSALQIPPDYSKPTWKTWNHLRTQIRTLHPDIGVRNSPHPELMFMKRLTQERIQKAFKCGPQAVAHLLKYLNYGEHAKSTLMSELKNTPNDTLAAMLAYKLYPLFVVDDSRYSAICVSEDTTVSDESDNLLSDQRVSTCGLDPLVPQIMEFTFEQKQQVFDGKPPLGVTYTEFGCAQLLHKLSKKKIDLEAKYGKQANAVIVAQTLNEKLTACFIAYLDSGKNEAAKKVFGGAWKEAIATAKPTLDMYRGWKNFLANLALHVTLLITTAGIGNMAAVGYAYHQSNGNTAAIQFFKTEEDSTKLINDLEKIGPYSKKDI